MFNDTPDWNDKQLISNNPRETPRITREEWPSRGPFKNIALKISTNVFAAAFPGVKYENGPDRVITGRKYISEEFKGEDIKRLFNRWESPAKIKFKLPILISAQTGAGKNYFITNDLREFAQSHNEKILYICNRVALNFQQKQELAKIMGNHLSFNSRWEDIEEFGCITVMTYHKLLSHLRGSDNSFFEKFQYVVLDECHFFYSDALFYTYTGEILREIPKKFLNSYRIYMTATPDPVIDPIYSAELDAIMAAGAYPDGGPEPRYYAYTGEFLRSDLLPPIWNFTFQRDYSAYSNILFFSSNKKAGNSETDEELSEKPSMNFNIITKEIVNTIKSSKKKDAKKWVVFVNSKKYGQELKKQLKKASITAQCFDKDSNSANADDETVVAWRKLQRTGETNCDVLITTSVLDNGFSIKDPKVGNIVLFTDDKTEFLQELGRVRLEAGQKVNIYIAKTSKRFELNSQQNKAYQDVLAPFYGNNRNQTSQGATAVNLWKTEADSRRALISLVDIGNGRLEIHTNDMAYYRLKIAEQEIKDYEALLAQDENKAPILYKLRWLSEAPPGNQL